jgi:hypothetical protein
MHQCQPQYRQQPSTNRDRVRLTIRYVVLFGGKAMARLAALFGPKMATMKQ